jgi:hypothetical protein
MSGSKNITFCRHVMGIPTPASIGGDTNEDEIYQAGDGPIRIQKPNGRLTQS